MSTDLSRFLDRYVDDVNDGADELLGMTTEVTLPSRYHEALLGLLDDILILGSDPRAPAPIRVMITTMRHLRPTAMEELANVEEADIRAFFELLHRRIERAMSGEVDSGGESLIPD